MIGMWQRLKERDPLPPPPPHTHTLPLLVNGAAVTVP